jgi:hypothetical protein
MRADFYFIQRAYDALGITIPNPCGMGKSVSDDNVLEVYIYENKWGFCSNEYCVIKPISRKDNTYRVYFDKKL